MMTRVVYIAIYGAVRNSQRRAAGVSLLVIVFVASGLTSAARRLLPFIPVSARALRLPAESVFEEPPTIRCIWLDFSAKGRWLPSDRSRG